MNKSVDNSISKASVESGSHARVEMQMRSVVENAADGIMAIDKNGIIILFNPASARIFGIESGKLAGTAIQTLIPDFRESVGSNEISGRRHDGTFFPIDTRISKLTDGESGLIVIVRDITERVHAEKALKQSQRLLRATIDSLSSHFIILDQEGIILAANRRWETFTDCNGLTPLGLGIGGSFFVFFQEERKRGSERATEVLAGIRDVVAGFQEVFDSEYSCLDEKYWFALRAVRIEVEGQIRIVIIQDDIGTRKQSETEHKKMEIQLRHAQKLESIGQLAAGIAHEINTPTQYIGDNTHFLRDAFAEIDSAISIFNQLLREAKYGELTPARIAEVEKQLMSIDLNFLSTEVPKAINQSLEGVSRVSEIVKAMKEFSHPGTTEKVPIDLNKAIESTITVARNEWKYVAEMSTDFDPYLSHVPCIPGEFNQSILNIIVNAAHAIGDVVGDGATGKGKISVVTRRTASWAEIRITDTGTGISEAARDKVFDPFFTTKEAGKGTGQGLAIAHSVIVDKHGGTIRFETDIGKGTTFIIRLPLVAAESENFLARRTRLATTPSRPK